jgi:hypothetical protein
MHEILCASIAGRQVECCVGFGHDLRPGYCERLYVADIRGRFCWEKSGSVVRFCGRAARFVEVLLMFFPQPFLDWAEDRFDVITNVLPVVVHKLIYLGN